jgi:hypothetical protein
MARSADFLLSGEACKIKLTSCLVTERLHESGKLPTQANGGLEWATCLPSGILRSATTGQIEFTSNTWNALVEYQVEEALIPGLRYLVSCVPSDVDHVRQDFVRLLSAVSVRTAQEQMHKAIAESPDCTPTAFITLYVEGGSPDDSSLHVLF